MPSTGQVVDHLVVGRGHDFHRMQQGLANNGIVRPKSLTTENKTCWTIDLTLTRREMLPIVTMVALLKPDRILPAKLSQLREMLICLKAGSCNWSAALLGSTNTLCKSKSLIHKVSTSASLSGVMTMDGLIGGKDIGSLIGWISLLLYGIWMVITRAWNVAAHNILLFWHLD